MRVSTMAWYEVGNTSERSGKYERAINSGSNLGAKVRNSQSTCSSEDVSKPYREATPWVLTRQVLGDFQAVDVAERNPCVLCLPTGEATG
jgi:hypothetical protein